jgi:uncharacterized membrane protein
MQQSFHLRDLVPMLAIDVAIPYGLYVILSPHFPSNSLIPLLISALTPMISSTVGVIRKRHIDYVGALVVLGILITVVAAFITGDQKIFLIRESVLTAALGVVFLVSLLFPKPLMFYFGKQFFSGGDPAKAAFYSSLWQSPKFRSFNYLITLVWGIGLLIEFTLRVIMVYTLPVAQVIALSPIVFNAITIGLILWTVAYGNRARRKRQQQSQDQAAEVPAQVPSLELHLDALQASKIENDTDAEKQ